MGTDGMIVERGKGWSMHLGECVDVLTTIGAPVDHCIMDPPYESGAHTKGRRCRGAVVRTATRTRSARKIVATPLDFVAMTPELRRATAELAARYVRRWTLAFCQIEGVHLWMEAFAAAGLTHRRTGVWTKPDGQPQLTGDRPGVGFECIEMVHPKGRSRWNGGGHLAVFDCNKKDPATPYGKPNEHPTQKPVPLLLRLVELFTDPGETILDPFAGSGTTGVACLRRGREFVGVERDRKYFDLACERLTAEEQGITLEAKRGGQLPLLAAVAS